jgi:hypothetical protein
VIDNPDQAERLFDRLTAALPLPARMTPELAATLQAKNTATEIPSTCSITWISYAGDEGGIVCRLEFAREIETAAFASITHLRFARPPAAGARHRSLPEAPRQTLAASAVVAGDFPPERRNAVKGNRERCRRTAYPKSRIQPLVTNGFQSADTPVRLFLALQALRASAIIRGMSLPPWHGDTRRAHRK